MQKPNFATLLQAVVLTLCLTASPALANPIDVEQARNAVETFRKKPARNGARRAAAVNKGKLQHAYTKSTAAGTPAVYVFNTGGGFILASADDATVPVLGYSDNGDFDPDNIPPALQYMMGEYAKQIAALPPRKAGAALPTPTYEVEHTTPIQPLIQSHWEQQAPYNAECPTALSPSGRAATGCMTTALAQIMRYHKWPTTGYSSREQDAAQGVGTTQVVRDYYTRNYQWDLMHYYTSQYTKTTGGGFNFGASDVKAVSQLMMDIAVGLSTEFGGVSSAVNIAIIPMLLSYFNYDAGIEEVKLKDYTTEEFNHIVITDLLAGRPVYFQGGPTSAGHAFVCDGYNGEGHFHINWGWGGTSDGYYLVTGLTPSAAGTGGAAGMGYSESLLAIHNIMPCRDGVVARPEVKAHYTTPIDPGYQIVKENGTIYFAGNFGVFPQTATQQRNFRGKLGLRVEMPGSAAQTVWNAHQTYTQMLRTIPYRNFHVDFNSAWAVEGTRITYIYQECGASAPLDVYNTRGDVCSFLVKKNSDGELVAVAEDIEYSLADLVPVVPASTVNVTYNIYLNGNSIGSTTVAEVVGQAPSKSFVPEYFVDATGFPTTITSSGGTYTIQSSYKDTMPFQTGKAYNVSFNVGGNTYMWCISSGSPKEQMNPSASAGNEASAQWRFDGDWFNGFTIRNWSTNGYITTTDTESNDIRTLSSPSPLSDRSYFLLQQRGDGFYFRLKNSNLCLAHTKPSKLEISVYDQKNYAGNLVTFTSPGYVPQPTGITYTVDISGLPEGETSALYYKGQPYNHGSKFNAVELTKDQLAATTIEGYDCEITIGSNTVYVVYTAQPMATVTYNVSITGYPSGQNPVLYYNNQPVQGNQLVATDLSLMQLSATHIDNYTCDIRIAARNITVTYTAINYVTYNVNFTGVPTGQTAKLYYNGQEVSGTQFTAGNLVVEQLYATGITDYSYKITIGTNSVTVMYYPLELHFDTTTGYNNTINTLTKEPVTVSYFGYDGKNNIYIGIDHTEVNSTGEPIVKIVFENIENFGGVNASVGTLDRTTGIWTAPDGGVASVKFTGGDGFSTGLMVYLKSSDTPTPTPTTYTISFSGHPSGQSPQLFYNGEAVSGTQLTATNLNLSQLSATTIAGYSYHISIGTNTISVVYTADTPTGTTYTVSISGAPSGQTPVLYYNGQPVGTQFTATNLNQTQLSATDIPGYTYNITIGTNTVSVVYTPTGTTYTIVVTGAPAGAVVTLDGQNKTTGGTYTVDKQLSLDNLTVTEPNGYYADKAYDQDTHTFTVTYHAYYKYPVVVVGTSNASAGVVYNDRIYHDGEIIQTKSPIYVTNVTPAYVTGQEGTVVFENSTFTVTYRMIVGVDIYFYREGASGNERHVFQKEGVSVECYNVNPGLEYYAAAELSNSTNGNLVVSSDTPITKIEMSLKSAGGWYNNYNKFTKVSCDTGDFAPNDDDAVWTGSANTIVFTETGNNINIGHMVIYIAGPTEEEKAMQEAREAIAAGTAGYPVLTEELRKAPEMAAYVAYYDNPAGYTGSIEELQTSFNYFLDHCTEVNQPLHGHAYKLSVRSSDGTQHWFLDNEGGVTNQESQAAVFVVGGTGKGDFNTLFVSNDNTHPKYLRSNGATADQYTTGSCDFKLSTMLKEAGTGISTSAVSRLGTFCFRPQATGSLPMTLDTSDHSWKLSTSTYMDGTKSSAIELTEVEYPYTSPTLTADDERAKGAFASIYLPFPMQFPDGVEAYKGTQEHSAGGKAYLALERIDTGHAVPAGGYILYSEEHTAGDPVQVEPAAVVLNDTRNTGDAVFIGSTEGPTKGDGDMWAEKLQGKNPYVLAKKNGIIGFYRYTGQTFPKGKAIWLAPDNESSETVRFGFEDIIETIRALHATDGSTEIYNLQGLRLDKPAKGQINIVNGKRVMIK